MKAMKKLSVSTLLLTLSTALASTSAFSCTRLVYHGADEQIVTARSMDWKRDVETNLWVFPKGMNRNGKTGENAIRWKSLYGSVISSGYDISTTDGVNEQGLSASLLWLVESEYPQPTEGKPGLSISLWAQYVLDNFATVAQAVEHLQTEPFALVTDAVPGENRLATLHLAMSDPSGDSAIIEYIDGKQTIHHSPKYQVMTNSPTFEKQLALNSYWQEIGGTVMLPGTNRSADRFARASFYVDAIPKIPDPLETLASVFSVIRNVSVPYGISTPDQPNISSTRWRTVVDHKRKLYFFESALTPNVFWIDLKKLDFSSETGEVLKLELGPDQRHVYSAEANANLKPSKPFDFLGI